MAEGNVYLCSWKKTSEGIDAQLLADESVRVMTKSFSELKELLQEQIIEWNGDGEAVVELIPPSPSSTKKGINLYTDIGYNNRANVLNSDSLYGNGYCSKCQFSLGQRNNNPLEIEGVLKGACVGVVGSYPIIQIYTWDFIKLLIDRTETSIEVLPVLKNGKETGYVEIKSVTAVKNVGCNGAEYPSVFQQSWQCDVCNRSKFIAQLNGASEGEYYLSSNSFHGQAPNITFVDSGMLTSIVLRNDLWSKIAKDKASKGIVTSPVVVLDDKFVEVPQLPTPKEFDWV